MVRRRFRGPVAARMGVSQFQQEDVRSQCETKLLEGWVYLPLVKISMVAVLQLQAKSCSPLRPKAQLPLASLTPRSSLQGGGSGVLG